MTHKLGSLFDGSGGFPLAGAYEGVSGTIRANAGDNRMAVCYPDVVDGHILDDQGGSQITVREDGKSPTLRAEMRGNVPCVLDSAGFKARNGAKAHGIGYQEEVAPTLGTDQSAYVCARAYSVENHPADSRVNIDESGKVQTLTSRMGTGGGNVPMIMEQKPVFCLQGSMIGRADKNGPQGDGVNENVAFTCNTTDRYAVVIALDRASFNQGQNAKYDFEISDSGINSTLTARGTSAVAYVDTTHADDVVRIDDTVAPLQARDFKGGKLVCQSYGIGNGQVNQSITEEQVGTLNCMNDQQAVLQTKPQYIVRRLTPTECARLQGFPDWWGHIAQKDELTDEEYSFWMDVRNTHARINGKSEKEYTKPQMLTWYNKLHTDSAEYKMWGNGIALPPALYCMQGIMEVLASGKTTSDPLPVRCDDAEIGEQMRLF